MMTMRYADDYGDFDRDIDCDGIESMNDEYDGNDVSDCDSDGHVDDGGIVMIWWHDHTALQLL